MGSELKSVCQTLIERSRMKDSSDEIRVAVIARHCVAGASQHVRISASRLHDLGYHPVRTTAGAPTDMTCTCLVRTSTK